MADNQNASRDLVAIGCSAGGVETLPRLLSTLPPGIPAAFCITMHIAPTHDSQLVNILARSTPTPVQWAEQGDPIEHGRVYVAPPDVHFLINEGRVHLTRGARENHVRPSIDKLFRSAAASHGSRAVGVLMTGTLDDGVAGLRAIRDAGGFAIVQAPDDAPFPELPLRALQVLEPDRVLRAEAIAQELIESALLAVQPAVIPDDIGLEATLDRDAVASAVSMDRLGKQTTLACPACSGPMWEIGDAKLRRYRCYLGHVESARAMLTDGTTQMEAALWSAVRALADRATTLETLAADAYRLGQKLSGDAYSTRATEAREQAELARQFIFDVVRWR